MVQRLFLLSAGTQQVKWYDTLKVLKYLSKGWRNKPTLGQRMQKKDFIIFTVDSHDMVKNEVRWIHSIACITHLFESTETGLL